MAESMINEKNEIAKEQPQKINNYYARFYAIWLNCIAEGYTTNDARDFAEMELRGSLFHNN